MGREAEPQFGNLRVAWLEAFVLSVRFDKQTAAAAEMGVTQGTISKHIENLECWYGGDTRRFLLWPNMWPPTLTDDGKAFLPIAERAVAALSELKASRPRPDASRVDPQSLQGPADLAGNSD